MRQINLNGTFYEVKDDIRKSAVSPWIAKIGSGVTEYSDFSTAALEEYHDFRNGIGKNRGLASEARLEFSEGIDFTTEGQAVLDPLVNATATFGKTPVKIIDFDGSGSNKTYAIGDDLIAEWSGSAWTSRETGLSDPIDAIVIQDATDKYLIVSSATTAKYTTDGTTFNDFYGSLLDFTEVDTNSKLTVTATKATGADVDADEDVYLYADKGAGYFNALDIDFELYLASTSDNGAFGGMAITNTVNDISGLATTDIVVFIAKAGGTSTINLVRGANVATDAAPDTIIFADTVYYCTLTRVAGNDSCVVTIYSDAGRVTLLDTLTVAGYSTTKYRYVFGFINWNTATGGENFDGYVQNLEFGEPKGYLADYANKLYWIKTDGSLVGYSATGNIDSYGGRFNLTGNYGTVYDLFEGKLLADGTPVLYFCGTEGIYTIDVTNEKAYGQEVAYPSLTYAGHKGMYWNASVWVSTGFGILKITPSIATEVGPNQDDGLPSTYQGSIFDMVTVNNWLVYCVNKTLSTDKSSILKRNSSYGGSLQVYTSAANTAITCLHHTPSSATYPNGRLWFGEGTAIKTMMFPDTTSNVKQVSTYEYVDDSGYGKFPIFRKLAAITKVALGVAAITKSCDSDDYIEVFYGLNGAAPTTSLGTFKSSPRPTILTFGSGLGAEFYTIQFAIKLFRNGGNTTSPELESLLFYYLPRPETTNSWTFNVVATSENAEEKIAAFETLRDTKTLMVFYPTGDTNKTSYNVALSTMPMRFYVENQQTRQGVIQISVQEVFNG